MLDLNAGVHLNEIVVPIPVHQELHCAGIDVTYVLGDLDCVCMKLFQCCLGDTPGRGILYYLLIAALEGAVPLPQVKDIPMRVGQNLNLKVLWLHQEFFDEDILVAEGLPGLVLHQLELAADLLLAVTAAHAPAAAASRRLQNDGEAVGERLFHRLIGILQRLRGAGNGGDAAGNRGGLGGQLVAHLVQDMGGRTDKSNPRRFTGPGEIGVLREESITGVDGVHAPALGQVDDGRNVQIGPQRRLVFADKIGLIGLGAEKAVRVLVGVHSHRVEAQVVASAENTNGDFSAICDQNLVEAAFCHAF